MKSKIMQCRLSLLSAAIFLFSLTTCQKDREATTPVSGDKVSLRSAPRPFKGTVYEVLVDEGEVECDCGDAPIIGYSGGPGKMTHMGKVTSKATACIEDVIFDENGVFVEALVDGVCISLTAANGDELLLEGDAHIIRPDPDCGCETAAFRATVTGGSGRFEDATGWADVFLRFDPATGIYTEEYDGKISY